MPSPDDVVITGLGVVSPIGIGLEAFQDALDAGRSGVRPLTLHDPTGLPVRFGGEVVDFDGKQYVRPRKSIKVMSRDIQLAFAAVDQAVAQSGIAAAVDPERFGVVFGCDLIQPDPDDTTGAFRGCIADGDFEFGRWGETAVREIYPLWMLKHLPNMPACHVAIAFDARGPNNTVTLGDVSSLSAVAEARQVLRRGWTDAMVSGGTGTRLMPTTMARNCAGEASRENEAPERAARPFDFDRDGEVFGEGAAAVMLETRRGTERRGALALARIAGFGGTFGRAGEGGATTEAIVASIEKALAEAQLTAADIGFVVAHGRGTVRADIAESQAIRRVLGDVPVTVPKSYYGNLGSGGGAVDLVVAVGALIHGRIPPTLNYRTPDPDCPVRVVADAPLAVTKPTALLLSQTPMGQAAAMVVARDHS